MSLTRLIARSRAAGKRLLIDRCTITRGVYPDHANVATDVPCRVKASSARAAREVDVAQGETMALPTYELRVNHDTDVERDDVVTITTSQDPQFSGRWLTVVEVLAESTVGTRTVLCREQQT